jgi:antitoxin component of RelBE/YafQ-DinJ toxin-antitoxin module
MPRNKPSAFRFDPEVLGLLKAMARKMGVTQSTVMELCIRHMAKLQKVQPLPLTKEKVS